MTRRILALLLALCLVLSLPGCKTGSPDAGTAPAATTVPTEPPTTLPDASELYTDALSRLEEAVHLNLSVSVSSKRSVGGETYTESSTQTISIQNRGREDVRAAVQDSTTIGSFVLETQEYFADGQVWMLFDNLPFTSQMEAEDYFLRFAPAAALEISLYGDVSLEPTASGYTLHFANPSAGESWSVPGEALLNSASGTAYVDTSGNLTKSIYSVSYRYGSTLYEEEYTISVTLPETLSLSNTIPATEEEYITLDFIDAPLMLQRSAHVLAQTGVLSYTANDTMVTQAGGAIFSQQETLDIHGTGADTMLKYTLDITLQNYQEILDKYSLEETLKKKVYKATENDAPPFSQRLDDSQIELLRDENTSLAVDFLWSPKDIAGASIEDLGSVYLLQLTGSDALGDTYEATAANSFWGDESFLRNLAENYRTDKLEAYLSIDKYTGLPVAFGFDYTGIHTIEGQEYALTDQWNQTLFLGSTTAYNAITDAPSPDEEPAEKPTPLFYHVTGENGQEMWLIGTIHVGDNRTGYLPQEISDALLSSDALAVEFDSDAFDEALETDTNLLSQVQSAYFFSDGSMTAEHLEEEIYEDAVKLLKASGNYHMNAEYMKPYLWSQSIDNFLLQQCYNLTSEKGVDNRLMAMARENEIPIWDVESGLFQIQMITGFSPELQALLLEDTLYTTTAEYSESLMELYELWLAGDEAALRKELSDEVDTSELTEEELAEYESEKHLIDEYNKAMSYDRNDGMLKKAISYLESGDVVFYAVGLAHLLNNVNGLVDTLRQAGYSVEPVTFAQ